MRTEITQTITFGREGDAQIYLAFGWSDPEDGFTWIDGTAAGLIVPMPNAPNGFFIELHGWPHLGGRGESGQCLMLTANGQDIGKTVIDRHMRVAWFVPPQRAGDRNLVIGISVPDAAKPTNGADDRMLAFAAISLRIMPAASNVEKFRPRVAALPVASNDQLAREFASRMLGSSISDIALQVESIGCNCELGFFQRFCGVEPLSLLRFSGVMPRHLVESLDNQFQFLGNQDAIDPVPEETNLRDWIVYERRHFLRYHTWVDVNDATREQMRVRESKKLGFLRTKFLDDLRESQKIFVHHDARAMGMEVVLPLFLAIRRYGPATLLYLVPSDDEHQPGLVEEILPGLLRGYMSRFSIGGEVEPSTPDWLAVISGAMLLRDYK